MPLFTSSSLLYACSWGECFIPWKTCIFSMKPLLKLACEWWWNIGLIIFSTYGIQDENIFYHKLTLTCSLTCSVICVLKALLTAILLKLFVGEKDTQERGDEHRPVYLMNKHRVVIIVKYRIMPECFIMDRWVLWVSSWKKFIIYLIKRWPLFNFVCVCLRFSILLLFFYSSWKKLLDNWRPLYILWFQLHIDWYAVIFIVYWRLKDYLNGDQIKLHVIIDPLVNSDYEEGNGEKD